MSPGQGNYVSVHTFQAVVPDGMEESATDSLLAAIFEFGCFNMYGAFDRTGTARELAHVLGLLNRHQLPIQVITPIVDW